MKKDELLEIGLTEEQADKVFAINGKDVERVKTKMQSDIDELSNRLTEAKETITTLEASKGDADQLQAELDKYRQAETERQKAEQEAEETARLLERFNAVKGDNEFSSEYAEKGVLDAFKNALSNPDNTGKGDAELFSALTKDKEGIFASKHPPVNMGGFRPIDQDGVPTTLAGALKERYQKG